MPGALLTCSRTIFGTVGPTCGLCEAQLPAEDVGSLQREVVIADGAPFPSSLYLHTALEGLPGEAGQPEPQPLAFSPLLRGRGWGRRSIILSAKSQMDGTGGIQWKRVESAGFAETLHLEVSCIKN